LFRFKLHFLVVTWFVLLLVANLSWAFLPTRSDLERQWARGYAKANSFVCFVTWPNYPKLELRIWHSQKNTLRIWVEKEPQKDQLVGASLLKENKVIASTFAYPLKKSVISYLFYSPYQWQKLGIDFGQKRLLVWQDKMVLKIGNLGQCLYLDVQNFYPVGVKLGTLTIGWSDFVLLGNLYFPSKGWIKTLRGKEVFKLDWIKINTSLPKTYFDLATFSSKYRSVSWSPKYKSLFSLLATLF